MLPARLLDVVDAGDTIVPRFLTEADHPWLLSLLDEVARFEGRPWGELKTRLADGLPRYAPHRGLAMAQHVLLGLCGAQASLEARPRDLRSRVFVAAQQARQGPVFDRNRVLAEVGASIGVAADELDAHLFADLPDSKRLRLPEGWPAPTQLALRVNLALAQGLLARSLAVDLELRGNARAVVREAHRRQLLCVARSGADEGSCTLEISGALSLFRRTVLYGRRLASLIPVLPWCSDFELRALCQIDGKSRLLRLGPEAPVFPADPPRRYDSRVEARFAREFARLAPGWDLEREPQPVSAGDALFFPDFGLVARGHPERRWLLEIVGFWTPEYLERKLRHLEQAPEVAMLLCIDEQLNVDEGALPPSMPVVRYERWVDCEAVLKAIESRSATIVQEPPWEETRLRSGELFVDFAGRQPAGSRTHLSLGRLSPGDALSFRQSGRQLLLVDSADTPVAALSARGRERWLPRLGDVLDVTVGRVDERQATASGLGFREHLRVDTWRVPQVIVRTRATRT